MSDSSKWSRLSEEDVQAIISLKTGPRKADVPKELRRWWVWIEWLKNFGPGAIVFAFGAGRTYAKGKADQEAAKVDVLAAKAAELAAGADCKNADAEFTRAQTVKARAETLREENCIIDDAIASDPFVAKLKLANILSHRPDIFEQFEKVQDICTRLRLQHGFNVELQVSNEIDEPAGAKGTRSVIVDAIPGRASATGNAVNVVVGQAVETEEAFDLVVGVGQKKSVKSKGNLSGTSRSTSTLIGTLVDAGEPPKSHREGAGTGSSATALESNVPNFKSTLPDAIHADGTKSQGSATLEVKLGLAGSAAAADESEDHPESRSDG